MRKHDNSTRISETELPSGCRSLGRWFSSIRLCAGAFGARRTHRRHRLRQASRTYRERSPRISRRRIRRRYFRQKPFHAAAKPAPWLGVRDVLEWGHIAQQPLPASNYDYLRAVLGALQLSTKSEDCLTLNVWTPGLKDGARRAVLFSVHGGGYTGGTSNQLVFDGANLARMHDLVVVTVNHRLGALGFMNLAEFDPDFAPSGVVGLMDLVAALEWVRENIANFGGDPNRVLIIGQSGGGSKMCHLMVMPSAKGLFQRTGVESGAALRSGTRENAAKSASASSLKLA